MSLVKLDIQGAELAALRGARETLRRFRPAVLCEVVDVYWGSRQQDVLDDLYRFMDEMGYHPEPIKTPFRFGRPSEGMNVLFVTG